jgi:hypothetical protein
LAGIFDDWIVLFGYKGAIDQKVEYPIKNRGKTANLLLDMKAGRPYLINIWFFSHLVVESLVDFKSKVSQIMEAVSFTFNDLDFVIHSFQFTVMDRVIAVVKDTISVSFQHFCEGGQ